MHLKKNSNNESDYPKSTFIQKYGIQDNILNLSGMNRQDFIIFMFLLVIFFSAEQPDRMIFDLVVFYMISERKQKSFRDTVPLT